MNPERVLHRLEWTVIRRLDGILQGDYRTLFRGFGLDFADLREYQFGDDIRAIDWNVTARMQVPYTRQYTEDREVTAWFLLDLSPSVDFGTALALKRNLLIDFVGVLARLLTRHGNRIAAIIYETGVDRVMPPLGGTLQVLRLIREVTGRPALSAAPFTDLSTLLEAALNAIRRRSLVFVISDFISAPGWERTLTMLSRRHELLAVRLYDPREIELPDVGPVFVEDAETHEQVFVDTHDRHFRARFRAAAMRREYELKATFLRAGVDSLALSTEDDLAKELVRFAVRRKHRKTLPSAYSGVPSKGAYQDSDLARG